MLDFFDRLKACREAGLFVNFLKVLVSNENRLILLEREKKKQSAHIEHSAWSE